MVDTNWGRQSPGAGRHYVGLSSLLKLIRVQGLRFKAPGSKFKVDLQPGTVTCNLVRGTLKSQRGTNYELPATGDWRLVTGIASCLVLLLRDLNGPFELSF